LEVGLEVILFTGQFLSETAASVFMKGCLRIIGV